MTLPPTWDMFGDDHLPHRLQLLAKLIDRETARQLQRDFAMSLAEWRVLAYVSAAGSASAAEVCAACAIDRAEASRAIARLEANLLIERTADPKHRKRLIVSPTDSGRATFERIRDQRRTYFQQIMADVPNEVRAPLNTSLRAIALRVLAAT